MSRRAFTLLELLLVLALITAISALGVASFRRQYARAQFKSAVVALQIDLNRTRLLAMRTGEAYLFRYVPGSGIYEIAPLRTLQEAIYRANGEVDEDETSALGGSLTSQPLSPTLTQYSDDLFSQENIIADLAAAGRTTARLGATSVDLTSPLGGSLTDSSAGYAAVDYGLSAVADPFATTSADAFGVGGQFTLDGGLASALSSGAMSTTLREMNVDERAIGNSENTIAWRVNMDGLVVRKALSGNAIFTFSRISLSTPTNLRSRRPASAPSSDASPAPVDDAAEGVDLGSRLGGSLTSIPSGESSDALGGGLNAPAGFDELGMAVSDDAFDSQGALTSVWSEPILFYPNGKTSTVAIGLASLDKYQYYSEIAIRGMTGYARISGVSSTPLGTNLNDSALTQEQLFRLSHPMEPGVAVSGVEANAASGGLVGSSGSNAPSVAEPGLDQNMESLPDPFATSSTSEPADANLFAPSYGSTSGRTGYRFDAPGGANAGSTPIGVPPPSTPDAGGGLSASPFDAIDAATSVGGALAEPYAPSLPLPNQAPTPGAPAAGANDLAPVTTTTTASSGAPLAPEEDGDQAEPRNRDRR